MPVALDQEDGEEEDGAEVGPGVDRFKHRSRARAHVATESGNGIAHAIDHANSWEAAGEGEGAEEEAEGDKQECYLRCRSKSLCNMLEADQSDVFVWPHNARYKVCFLALSLSRARALSLSHPLSLILSLSLSSSLSPPSPLSPSLSLSLCSSVLSNLSLSALLLSLSALPSSPQPCAPLSARVYLYLCTAQTVWGGGSMLYTSACAKYYSPSILQYTGDVCSGRRSGAAHNAGTST